MRPPSPNIKETYKILRLIGALVLAMGTLVVLNVMIGPEATAGDSPDAQSQRVEFPAPTQPARQIDS